MQLVFPKYKFVSNILFVIFWMSAVLPFFFSEIFGLVNPANSILYMVGESVLALLGIWLLKSWKDITVIIIFLLISFISTCIVNGYSILYYLNGVRYYIGFLFVLPIIRYLFSTEYSRAYFLCRMDKYLYWFLWLQVPCMIYQCILYGAYDNVGGSMGWMMSGTISTLIYIISFYLMIRRWDNSVGYIANLKRNWILLFLLFPSGLNETKVSFIYLLFYLFLLVPLDRKYIKRLLVMLPILVVFMGGSFWLYYTMTSSKYTVKNVDDFQNYIFGDDEINDWVVDILERDIIDVDEADYARGIKIYVTPVLLEREPHGPLLGYGIGQFKGGTFVEKSKVSDHYNWFLKGTTFPLMFVWFEMGILGLIWYIVMWILYLKRDKGSVIEPRIFIYSILVMIVITLYAPSYLYVVFCTIYFYIMLASINWQYFKDLPVCKLSIPLFTKYTTIPINK